MAHDLEQQQQLREEAPPMLRRTLVVECMLQYCTRRDLLRSSAWPRDHRCRDCRHATHTERLLTNECLLGFLPLELYKELLRFIEDTNKFLWGQHHSQEPWEQPVPPSRECRRCVLRAIVPLP
jgi:hypothetical protein